MNGASSARMENSEPGSSVLLHTDDVLLYTDILHSCGSQKGCLLQHTPGFLLFRGKARG